LSTKVDFVERREHRERLRFEILLSELSTRFINLPAEQVDSTIEYAQRQVCECLDLDVSTLWQISADHPGSMFLTHRHLPPGFPPLPEVWDIKESFPWALKKYLRGESVILSRLTDAPPEAALDIEQAALYGVKSTISIPLSSGGGATFGVLNFVITREERDWPTELVTRLHIVAQIFANALVRRCMDAELRQSLEEVRQLHDRLQAENVCLRELIRRDDGHDAIVGQSEPVMRMLAKAKQVAPTDATVLISGETGTGKELLAYALHDMSRRRLKPMVTVNCAALPAALIESELFGREKGAYTGAMTQQIGRFELADGATIFLDEIGDLPLELQVKLLRVLEGGEFSRLGSSHTRKVDVRVIAATNHDMGALVRDGKFRADLFHRLNVFPIEVPPLRERVDDIPLLVWKFVKEFNKKMGRSIDTIPKRSMEQLRQYPWPGNVRELRNLIERAVIENEHRSLKIEFPAGDPASAPYLVTMEGVERKHIREVLEHVHWRISGKMGAAEILGLRPTTLHSRMKKLGISRPKS
jgi:formate hydrogenlyase transcriptional activator